MRRRRRGPRIRAAEVFAVEVGRISAAVSYYGNYRDEIAAEVTEADDDPNAPKSRGGFNKTSSHDSPAACSRI